MSSLLALGALGALAAVGRLMGGSWLAPGAFLPLVWVAYSSAALAFVALFPVCPVGLWTIASMVLAFVVGSVLVDVRRPMNRSDQGALLVRPDLWMKQRLVICTALLAVVCGIGIAALARSGFAQFGLQWSTAALLRLGGAFSGARYGGTDQTPRLITFLLYAAFPASVLGGMLAGVSERRAERWLSVTPLLLSLVSGALVAVRAGFVFTIVQWLGGFLAVKVYRSAGRYRLARPAWLVAGAVTIISLMGIYALLQWLRRGMDAAVPVAYLLEQGLASSVGSVAVFSEWVCAAPALSHGFGALTFAGPFELFGLAERVQGLYALPVEFVSGHSSNIYTMFRGLIEDFGLPGAWLFLMAVGYAVSFAYRRCVDGNAIWCIPLAVFYPVALISLLTSLFAYNTPIGGWLVAAMVWWWPPYRRSEPALEDAPVAVHGRA